MAYLFESKCACGKIGSTLDLYQFSANGKAYLTSGGSLRPFVNAGIGGYHFSPANTYFGGNVGAGLLKELTPLERAGLLQLPHRKHAGYGNEILHNSGWSPLLVLDRS